MCKKGEYIEGNPVYTMYNARPYAQFGPIFRMRRIIKKAN